MSHTKSEKNQTNSQKKGGDRKKKRVTETNEAKPQHGEGIKRESQP